MIVNQLLSGIFEVLNSFITWFQKSNKIVLTIAEHKIH